MAGRPYVSFILVNYNSSHYTLQCIESIREKVLNTDYEIIVVDNYSKSEEVKELNKLEAFQNVKVVKSSKNYGFTGGNIMGVNNSNPKSNYYFFLNNDCILINDILELLVEFMEQHSEVSVAVPQILNKDYEFQCSFNYFPTVGYRIFGTHLLRLLNKQKYPLRNGRFTEPLQVPIATGCALFIRREHYDELGGFDPQYFLYCEEEDFCMRVKLHRKKVYLVPAAQIIHFGGGSTLVNETNKKEYIISYFYFLKKFYIFPSRIFLKGILLFKMLKRSLKEKVYFNLALFILRGSPIKEGFRKNG